MTRHDWVTAAGRHAGQEDLRLHAAQPRELATRAAGEAVGKNARFARGRTATIRGSRATARSGGVHTLVLVGELNYASAHALEAEIEDLYAAGMSGITLDLRRLGSIDWIGARVIALRSELCIERGCEFELIPGPWFIQRVFDLAGLTECLLFRREPAETDPANAPVGAVLDVSADTTGYA